MCLYSLTRSFNWERAKRHINAKAKVIIIKGKGSAALEIRPKDKERR